VKRAALRRLVQLFACLGGLRGARTKYVDVSHLENWSRGVRILTPRECLVDYRYRKRRTSSCHCHPLSACLIMFSTASVTAMKRSCLCSSIPTLSQTDARSRVLTAIRQSSPSALSTDNPCGNLPRPESCYMALFLHTLNYMCVRLSTRHLCTSVRLNSSHGTPTTSSQPLWPVANLNTELQPLIRARQ
jgi:hypothetical protein